MNSCSYFPFDLRWRLIGVHVWRWHGQFVATVYADGAGYSDAIVLPADPASSQARVLAMACQRTFHPPQHGIEGGGYDIALALMPLGRDGSGGEGRNQHQEQ